MANVLSVEKRVAVITALVERCSIRSPVRMTGVAESTIAGRLANQLQLTTDGHKMYLDAVPEAFGHQVDYAQLVKVFGNGPEGQKRYSPAQCPGTKRVEVIGNPDSDYYSGPRISDQSIS